MRGSGNVKIRLSILVVVLALQSLQVAVVIIKVTIQYLLLVSVHRLHGIGSMVVQ